MHAAGQKSDQRLKTNIATRANWVSILWSESRVYRLTQTCIREKVHVILTLIALGSRLQMD